MKYYCFTQNNSGGDFEYFPEKGISEYVIIEALDSISANNKAIEIGIYFDGCQSGIDCDCCGDRWYEVEESDGKEVPSIYGKALESDSFTENCYVHYLDGSFKEFKRK